MFGTDQGYQAVANDFFSLTLTPTDIIFGSNYASIDGQPVIPEGINYASLVYNEKIVDGEEMNPKIVGRLASKINKLKEETAKLSIHPSSEEPDLYQVLSMFPQLDVMKEIIDVSNCRSLLQAPDKKTLIVPTNEVLEKSIKTWLRLKGASPYSEPANYTDPVQPYANKFVPSELGLPDTYYLRELVKAHLLSFELRPQDLLNRKLEVYTMRDSFSFIVDGTAKIKKELNMYQKPLSLLNYEYPLPIDRFVVKKIFEARNGIMYVIDGVFYPTIY